MVSRDLVYRFLKALQQEQGRRPETIAAYRYAYTYFWRHLQSQGLKAEKQRISKEHVKGWVASMAAAGLNPRTIRTRLAALSSMFRWMMEEGIIRGNPVALVRRPRASRWSPRGALTPEQAARIWSVALADRRKAGFQSRVGLLLVWHSAGRRQETLKSARWENLDLRKRAWWIREGKGGKDRWVPLSQLTVRHMKILHRLRGRPQEGSVLLSRTGRPLSETSFYGTIKRYCRLAGLPHISPHWFRHTLGTDMAERAESPADLQRIQEIFGHASLETTMVYVHVTPRHRDLLDRTYPGQEDSGEDLDDQAP